MLRPWNPTKEEIESCLRKKEMEFAQKDNKNPRVTARKYLEKYIFTDLHEVVFCDFPHLLEEWILRLKDNHAMNQIQ
jgi:signal recognition particle subunit SEC65